MRGKKNNWACFLMILAGIVIGGFIGSFFPDGSWINFGRDFGLTEPLRLDLGIICISFALQIKITVASIIGIVVGIIIYRFL